MILISHYLRHVYWAINICMCTLGVGWVSCILAYMREECVHSVLHLYIFAFNLQQGCTVGMQTHRRYKHVQGVPMCPKCGDLCVRASVCQRAPVVRPSGQQAQLSVPPHTPSSCQEKEAAVKMGVGCHDRSPTLKIQSPMLPRERTSAEECVYGP